MSRDDAVPARGGSRRAVLALAGAAALPSPVLADQTPFARMLADKYSDFSGAILVARGPQRLFAHAQGLANAEFAAPNRLDTPFRIGSISKLFTAQAVLLLVEEGRLSLDQPIAGLIPWATPHWADLRIAHLLDHTSGIPDIVRLGDFPERMLHATTLEAGVRTVSALPLQYAPGARTAYGNSGSITAAFIVQRLTGEPFEAFAQRRIYDRLSLARTLWGDNARVVPGRAAGYVVQDGVTRNAPFIDMTMPLACGAELSTVEDLHRWWLGLMDGRLLPAALVERGFTPARGNFGVGWEVDPTPHGRRVSHIGDINGFGAYLAAWPENGLFAVALSNVERTPVKALVGDLAEAAFKV